MSVGQADACMTGTCMLFSYQHFGRKAASTIAPEVPSSFPLRSAEVIEVSIRAVWLAQPKPSLVSVLCIVTKSANGHAVMYDTAQMYMPYALYAYMCTAITFATEVAAAIPSQ